MIAILRILIVILTVLFNEAFIRLQSYESIILIYIILIMLDAFPHMRHEVVG